MFSGGPLSSILDPTAEMKYGVKLNLQEDILHLSINLPASSGAGHLQPPPIVPPSSHPPGHLIGVPEPSGQPPAPVAGR